jgi:uncharacterized RDD family membrane protein YckC
MLYHRRPTYLFLFLLTFTLTVLALWAVDAIDTAPARAAAAPVTTAPSPATSTAPATAQSAPAAVEKSDIALLAAGDGHHLWVMYPTPGSNNEVAFQLLRRTADTGIWRPVLHPGENASPLASITWNTPSWPRALSLMTTSPEHPGAASPYLFGQSDNDSPGWVYRYFIDGTQPQPQSFLPPRHAIKAALGGTGQLFVVTLGRPVPGVTQIGSPLHISQTLLSPSSTPATAPAATTSAPATRTAETQDAGLKTPAAPADCFNVYWLPPIAAPTTQPVAPDTLRPAAGEWALLAPLGPPSNDITTGPLASSYIALAQRDNRLLAFWADPASHQSEIMLRTLDYTKTTQRWSNPVAISIRPDEMRAFSRLYALSLDNTLYLLWTVPNGKSQELHGGWLSFDPNNAAAAPKLHMIAPMPLDAAGTGLTAQDVAVGPSENSLVALAINHDSGLQSMVFDSRGKLLSPATPVNTEGPRHDGLISQNIAVVLTALIFALGLWQWRQKPAPFTLPKGAVIAPFHLRALAAGIDFVLPYVLVLFIFGDPEGPVGTFFYWISLLSNTDELAKATDLYVFLALYFLHITLTEIFFHRSAGKAALGLEVLTLDGTPPGIGAVLVRNIFRIPECFVGLVLLYMLMSPRRQRLGDMLARTVVIAREDEQIAAKKDAKNDNE